MGEIANRWTGNGLSDGVDIASNTIVQTSGNFTGTGCVWTRAGSGSSSFVTDGNGFRVISPTASGIARIDATLTATVTAMRTQLEVTVGARPTSDRHAIVSIRNTANSNPLLLQMDTTGQILIYTGTTVTAASTPAVAAGDKLLIDLVVALNASPTTSNGRFFYRVKNLTNLTWNGTGEFFYDSLYTANLQTTQFNAARFGKNDNVSSLPNPGFLYENLGVEAITVNPAHTSESQAKAYFADAPASTTPLPTPSLTLTSTTNPSTSAATDGTATVSWPAVSGAHHYVAEIANGHDATNGFTTRSSAAVSPYVFTGLGGGDYTLAITAYPTA